VIEYVSGKLVEKHPTYAVVDCSGLGYRLQISLSSYSAMGDAGSVVTLFTYHHVREDTEDLYGFVTPEERSLFELLIGVSGIGPKLAQAILSGIPAADLRTSLVNGDMVRLTRIPGVGRKTAERMVMELKEKVERLVPAHSGMGGTGGSAALDDEAVMALVALGFNRQEAQQAVGRIRKSNDSMAVEDVVRAAIQAVH
jgi:Holliday junction DNA helicase RuvA